MIWDAVLDLVVAEAYWQPGAAKISHSTPLPGCGASYDAGTMPVAFIYVYGRYTGLGCHPNVQGRPLGSILESGTVFVMLFSKQFHIGIQLRGQSHMYDYYHQFHDYVQVAYKVQTFSLELRIPWP